MAGRTRLRTALFLAVGLATTGLGLLAYGTNVFRDLDLRSVDARFSIRGKQSPDANIVVVKVDEQTFKDLQTKWEDFRPLHARLIRQLKKDRAKVIVYDVQFTEPSKPGKEADDNKLITAVGAAGNVILATTGLPVFGDNAIVREYGGTVGNAYFPPDPGGYLRRMRYEIGGLKTLAVAAAERERGEPVRRFPATWIDYRGPVGTFRSVSFSDALNGKVPSSFFRDKIVVVGPWASTFQDEHPVSFGNDLMPGPEIQANAISTVLRGQPLNSVAGWINITLIVVLGLLAPLSGLRFSLRGTLFVSLAAALGYLVLTQAAFERGWILSFVYPFGTLVASSVGALGAHYLLAAFERERVRDMFSRFVPEAVVEQVLARTDSDLRLGGVSLESTVMFTDLRGFTTFAETLPPPRVIECLNVYLEEMTEAILGHGGTLVSFEGDGIMAVFGAPIEQPDHADRAVASAREMLTVRLPRFNAYLRDKELIDGFKMGIGLNTGMVVSGNVGSERRLEYTAIGDTTNTASRIQGMTKGQAFLLYLSDTTRERLQREVEDLVFIDEMEVRGRQHSVKIWSIEAASEAAFEERKAAGYAPGALAR
jgi:adenylate cyclase